MQCVSSPDGPAELRGKAAWGPPVLVPADTFSPRELAAFLQGTSSASAEVPLCPSLGQAGTALAGEPKTGERVSSPGSCGQQLSPRILATSGQLPQSREPGDSVLSGRAPGAGADGAASSGESPSESPPTAAGHVPRPGGGLSARQPARAGRPAGPSGAAQGVEE